MALGSLLKLTLIGSIITTNAFAMGGARPTGPVDIEVSNAEIFKQFSLKAKSGSTTRIAADVWETIPGGGPGTTLPPEGRGADYSLCNEEHTGDTDDFLRRTRFLIDVSQVMTRLMGAPKPKRLTQDETKFLRTVPRCERFMPFLNSIQAELSESMTWRESLRLVKKQPRQFNSVRLQNKDGKGVLSVYANGQAHVFKLANKISFDSDGIAYNLRKLATAKGATGQGVAVKVEVSDIEYHGEQPYTYTESCTITEEVRVCRGRHGDWEDDFGRDWNLSERHRDGSRRGNRDRNRDRGERCRWVTIEKEGIRTVEVRNSPTTTEYKLALHKNANRDLAHIFFSIYDDMEFESRGECQ